VTISVDGETGLQFSRSGDVWAALIVHGPVEQPGKTT
jgi:hypothetical protein